MCFRDLFIILLQSWDYPWVFTKSCPRWSNKVLAWNNKISSFTLKKVQARFLDNFINCWVSCALPLLRSLRETCNTCVDAHYFIFRMDKDPYGLICCRQTCFPIMSGHLWACWCRFHIHWVHQIKQIFCATHHLNLKGHLNSIDFTIVGSSSSRFPKKSSDCTRRLLTFAGAKEFLLVLH